MTAESLGAMVSLLPETPFVRRNGLNGTIQSICTRCFITVAAVAREADLDEAEKKHVCDPWLVEHWKELAARDPSEGWDRKPPRR